MYMRDPNLDLSGAASPQAALAANVSFVSLLPESTWPSLQFYTPMR